MITIGSTTITTPQKFRVEIDDISNTRDRNAAGDTLIDRIATKRKLTMEWGPLSNTAISTLLGTMTAAFFTVKYPDPVTGAEATITCYVDKREAPVWKYAGGAPYWDGLKITLVEA